MSEQEKDTSSIFEFIGAIVLLVVITFSFAAIVVFVLHDAVPPVETAETNLSAEVS
ncbi:MAG: hypothetical protein KBC22_01255 [Candidatus Pacebacteria bacterium]|nr:hypothetical protein [Candidatus Paceibacterota bacterium]